MASPAVPQGSSRSRSAYIYELVESHKLQSLDLSRSLGSVCCGRGQWRFQHGRRNAVTPVYQADIQVDSPNLPRCARIINVGLAVGLPMIIVVHAVPVMYGRPIAVFATVVSFPALLSALRIVRYDVLVLLLKSYDFWYLFVVNCTTCGLLCAYLNDLRAVLGVLLWLGIFNGSIIDSRTLEIRKAVAANIFGAVASFVVLLLVQWGVVPGARHFTVLHYRDHALGAEDVITNGLATTAIMMGRNAIRRIQDLRQQKRIKCTKLRCVSYQCTIRYRRLESVSAQSILASGYIPQVSGKRPVFNEMVYVHSDFIYNARRTIFPVELNGDAWTRLQRLILAALMFFGISLMVLGFASVNHWPARLTRWLFAVGLTLTTVFCGFVWSMSHTKVLQQTFFSFDFVFLSLQLTSAHLCACDMFAWNSRCLGLLSSWLWIHLVLTSDALTPVVRQKLSMQTWHLAIPVLLFVIGQILFVCEIVFADHWALQDRRIHSVVVGNRRVEYRIIAFFFSRLVTILLWCLRLLWRILKAHPDDLVMLRGKVAYTYLNDLSGVVEQSEISEREPQLRAVVPSMLTAPLGLKKPGKASQLKNPFRRC